MRCVAFREKVAVQVCLLQLMDTEVGCLWFHFYYISLFGVACCCRHDVSEVEVPGLDQHDVDADKVTVGTWRDDTDFEVYKI